MTEDIAPIELVKSIYEELKTISELLKQQNAQNAVPWGEVLWTCEDIAAYLKVSYRTAQDRYSTRSDFPTPVRPGGGYPRWYAHEVLDWVRNFRPRRGRPANK